MNHSYTEYSKNHSCCFTTCPDRVLSGRHQVNREFDPKNKHPVKKDNTFEKSQHCETKITNSANEKCVSEEIVDRAIR